MTLFDRFAILFGDLIALLRIANSIANSLEDKSKLFSLNSHSEWEALLYYLINHGALLISWTHSRILGITLLIINCKAFPERQDDDVFINILTSFIIKRYLLFCVSKTVSKNLTHFWHSVSLTFIGTCFGTLVHSLWVYCGLHWVSYSTVHFTIQKSRHGQSQFAEPPLMSLSLDK